MILIVSLSGVASRIIPLQIPLPLIQIIAGAMLALPKIGLHVDFDPELFLVLFIPPLLFADGWKTPISEFFFNSREIMCLAIVLVFINVIGIGYLIYWMVPGIELIPAFALAAVLSPTDAVALSSIVGEDKMPKKIMSILQGEALMNDASGLVSLKFTIAIAMGTMAFSISGVSIEFTKVVVGGLLAGIILCWLFGKSLRLFSRLNGDDPATQTVLLLLLPFASYLLAEHFDLSGILATVSAGMTITRSGIIRQAPLAMRLRANSVWQMLEFIFNGMVFLMLGLQLPIILETSILQAKNDPNVQLWILFADIVLIYISLMIVRFSWLWIIQNLSNKFLKKRPMIFAKYSIKELLVATFAGVRGAITLAGVLSIPLILGDGKEFPARYELVFLATGVILFSLLIGVSILPLILHGIKSPDKLINKHETQIARIAMAGAAIKSLHKLEEEIIFNSKENISKELLSEINARIISDMRRRIDCKEDLEQSLYIENLEKRFRLTALRAERTEVYVLRSNKKISNKIMTKLLHELDLMEALLSEKI